MASTILDPKKWEIHLCRETANNLKTVGYVIRCFQEKDDVYTVQSHTEIIKTSCNKINPRISQRHMFYSVNEAMTATVKLVQRKLARTKQPYTLEVDETWFETPIFAKAFNDLMEIHPSKLHVNPIKINELTKKRRLVNRIKNLEI